MKPVIVGLSLIAGLAVLDAGAAERRDDDPAACNALCQRWMAMGQPQEAPTAALDLQPVAPPPAQPRPTPLAGPTARVTSSKPERRASATNTPVLSAPLPPVRPHPAGASDARRRAATSRPGHESAPAPIVRAGRTAPGTPGPALAVPNAPAGAPPPEGPQWAGALTVAALKAGLPASGGAAPPRSASHETPGAVAGPPILAEPMPAALGAPIASQAARDGTKAAPAEALRATDLVLAGGPSSAPLVRPVGGPVAPMPPAFDVIGALMLAAPVRR